MQEEYLVNKLALNLQASSHYKTIKMNLNELD